MMLPEQFFTYITYLNRFVLQPTGQFLRNWWWFFLPFLLKDFFLERWKWWRKEAWLEEEYNPILLELIMPQEVEKPMRAMESVFANVHQVLYNPPGSIWEEWIEGKVQTSIALEVASIEGEIHFYIRFDAGMRDAVESAFYSQYPSLEIIEAEDYTRKIPLNIPNDKWDLWGTAYKLFRDDAYPIKTYKDFETEKERTEEEKIDPVGTLLESFSRVGPGEQVWIQMVAEPVSPHSGSTWIKEAMEERDKMAKRPDRVAKTRKPILLEAVEFLIKGAFEETKTEEKKETIPPEMRMTPGEKEIVSGIERKASKAGFESFVRFIIMGKRDQWNKAHLRLPFVFFSNYTTQDMNALYPLPETLTKIKHSMFLPINYLRDRRKYLRQRRILRNYISRVSPFYPRSGGTFILNQEELASLFHFPSWRVSPVPAATRVESKTKAPPKLPKEE